MSHVLMKLNQTIGILSKLYSKQTYMYSKQCTILFLELIFFMPASYGVKTTKKHKINFELSKTEH